MPESFTIVEGVATRLAGCDITWLPPEAYHYVSPRLVGGVLELEAKTYTGAIPLGNGGVLRVLPKVGARAFGRMILVAEGLQESLREEFDRVSRLGSAEGDADWTLLLRRSFPAALRTIEKRSLRAGRRMRRGVLTSARGRIDVRATLLSMAKREEPAVHCEFKERSLDTDENRVLGAAARTLLAATTLDSDARGVAARWAQRFGRRRLASGDLEAVVSGLSERRYAGPRSYYAPALLMANLLLASSGVALEGPEVPSESLLVNTADVFEKYVRNLVSGALLPQGFVVTKGTSPSVSLFEGGKCELIPDVAVSRGGVVRLVVDAKYKTGAELEPGDCYQLFSYMAALDLHRGIVVSPGDGTGPTLSEHTTFDHRTILHVRMDLTTPIQTEARLAELLRSAA